MIIFSYHTKNYYICTHKNKHSQNIHINNNKNSNDKDRNCKQDFREYWHLKEGSSHCSGKSHGDCKGSLLKREHISLRGFGNFIIKRRAEKTARNIQKNTTVIIPAHDYPSFKPAKEFVEKMKNN